MVCETWPSAYWFEYLTLLKQSWIKTDLPDVIYDSFIYFSPKWILGHHIAEAITEGIASPFALAEHIRFFHPMSGSAHENTHTHIYVHTYTVYMYLLLSFRHARIRNYERELEPCRLEAVSVEFGDFHPLKPIMVGLPGNLQKTWHCHVGLLGWNLDQQCHYQVGLINKQDLFGLPYLHKNVCWYHQYDFKWGKLNSMLFAVNTGGRMFIIAADGSTL